MYNKIFEELVNDAVSKSDLYYHGQEKARPNPFYIGFGNPESKLLIIGQEKAIDDSTEYGRKQMNVESTDNPYQWEKIIVEKIFDLDYRFDSTTHFKNPRFPYCGKPPKGNTWNQYQLLVSTLFSDIENRPNSFLNKSFIRLVAVGSLKRRKNALFPPDKAFFMWNSRAISHKKSLVSRKNGRFCRFVPHRNKSNILEAQIRECFGRVVWSHKTQEKCTDILTARNNCIKNVQIILAGFITTGLLLRVFKGSELALIRVHSKLSHNRII